MLAQWLEREVAKLEGVVARQTHLRDMTREEVEVAGRCEEHGGSRRRFWQGKRKSR